MRLTLVVTGGVRSEAPHTARSLALAARAAGHDVTVFLAGDGTAHAAALAPLRDGGARVVACSADAAIRGLDHPGRGSFVDLGDAVAGGGPVVVL